MSVKWISYFFDETDLSGPRLLLALALADHADAEGVCWPGVKHLSGKTRLQERRIRDLLRDLEETGYVEIAQGNGRGNLTRFQLVAKPKGGNFELKKAAIFGEERGQVLGEKAAISGDKGGNFQSDIYKPLKPTKKPSSSNPELTELWEEAIADACGAKEFKNLADSRRWSRVIEKCVAEQKFTSGQMVEAITQERSRVGDQVQYFTPERCLQRLQMMPSASSSTRSRGPTARELLEEAVQREIEIDRDYQAAKAGATDPRT